MNPWYVVLHEHTGEPTPWIICGECSGKVPDLDHHLQEIKDHDYTSNCFACGKNCGDYFHRKAA